MNAHVSAVDVIKKHANRRLYNVRSGSYVTLEDLAVMVREGRDFIVVDTRTRRDITRATLAQVLCAAENRTRHKLLSTDFMVKLLRLRGEDVETLVPNYLDATLSILAERRAPGSKPRTDA